MLASRNLALSGKGWHFVGCVILWKTDSHDVFQSFQESLKPQKKEGVASLYEISEIFKPSVFENQISFWDPMWWQSIFWCSPPALTTRGSSRVAGHTCVAKDVGSNSIGSFIGYVWAARQPLDRFLPGVTAWGPPFNVRNYPEKNIITSTKYTPEV